MCPHALFSQAQSHLKLSCVVKAEPLFMPSTLQVPSELHNDLLSGYKELIATEFGLAL